MPENRNPSQPQPADDKPDPPRGPRFTFNIDLTAVVAGVFTLGKHFGWW